MCTTHRRSSKWKHWRERIYNWTEREDMVYAAETWRTLKPHQNAHGKEHIRQRQAGMNPKSTARFHGAYSVRERYEGKQRREWVCFKLSSTGIVKTEGGECKQLRTMLAVSFWTSLLYNLCAVSLHIFPSLNMPHGSALCSLSSCQLVAAWCALCLVRFDAVSASAMSLPHIPYPLSLSNYISSLSNASDILWFGSWSHSIPFQCDFFVFCMVLVLFVFVCQWAHGDGCIPYDTCCP